MSREILKGLPTVVGYYDKYEGRLRPARVVDVQGEVGVDFGGYGTWWDDQEMYQRVLPGFEDEISKAVDVEETKPNKFRDAFQGLVYDAYRDS